MENYIKLILDFITRHSFRILAAALIFFAGSLLARFLANLTEKLLTRAHVEKTIVAFAKHITYVILFTFVIIAVLAHLGVQTAPLVALLGAAGLAVGLALQGSLSNFATGILIVLIKPFKVGDFIEAGGTKGRVTDIQLLTTVLRAPDNKTEIVPNSKIMGGTITNFTAIERRRIDLVFSISYTDNIKVAKETLEEILNADERVLEDPKPVIAVSELSDSGVSIVCRPWVKPEDYWGVRFETLEKGKTELEKRGITIPFPQRDVHLHTQKEGK